LSMASKIKERGIISMVCFIELRSILGPSLELKTPQQTWKKTYFLFVENWKLELWAGWYQKTQVFNESQVFNVVPSDAISLLSNFIVCCTTSSYRLVFLCAECLIAWSAPPCHALATQFPEFSSTSKISSRLLHRCPLLAVAGLLTHVLKLGVVYYTLIGAARVWISDSISLNNSLLWQKKLLNY
jgi:hypothetical protein